jgi:Uma2 family endonuclease
MCPVVIEEEIRIPGWVNSLNSFRRWALSPRFPERGRISYIQGEVWVDMSPEDLFTHNQVKGEYGFVLRGLARRKRQGRYCPDGMLLVNVAADLSTEPDGMFISNESRLTRRVRLVRSKKQGYMEVHGSPDMTLEIVSYTSVHKDTEVLMERYWKAGITEYWLVDARGPKPIFTIFQHSPQGYVAVPKQAGWQKSAVFGKSFKLIVKKDKLGDPEYTLSVR